MTTMRTSDSIVKLTEALLKAQEGFKPVIKSADNPYFSSKYAPLDEVVESVKDSLHVNGLVIIQTFTQLLPCLVVTTRLQHISGEWIESDFPAEIAVDTKKNTPQSWCSASTYLRRYSLMAILNIAPADEDDDGNAASHPVTRPYVQKSASPTPPVSQVPQGELASPDFIDRLAAELKDLHLPKPIMAKLFNNGKSIGANILKTDAEAMLKVVQDFGTRLRANQLTQEELLIIQGDK